MSLTEIFSCIRSHVPTTPAFYFSLTNTLAPPRPTRLTCSPPATLGPSQRPPGWTTTRRPRQRWSGFHLKTVPAESSCYTVPRYTNKQKRRHWLEAMSLTNYTSFPPTDKYMPPPATHYSTIQGRQ